MSWLVISKRYYAKTSLFSVLKVKVPSEKRPYECNPSNAVHRQTDLHFVPRKKGLMFTQIRTILGWIVLHTIRSTE